MDWSPYLVAAAVLDAVRGALAVASTPPTRWYVSAGQVAWDVPDQLTVGQVGRLYRSENFPVEARGSEVDGFGGLWVVPLAVVLVRCVPVIDDHGNPPTGPNLDEAHACVYRDAAIVTNTLTGPLPDPDWERAQVTQELVGGLGGLIAIDTRITIGVEEEQWCI